MCEKGSGERTGSIQHCCLSKPQLASHAGLVCVLPLTVDEVGAPAAFPIPRWGADSWGRCTSETTGLLSEAPRTSPTSAPAESAAGGRPPRHTAQTQFTDGRKYADPVGIWHRHPPGRGRTSSLPSCFSMEETETRKCSSGGKKRRKNEFTDENKQNSGSRVHYPP